MSPDRNISAHYRRVGLLSERILKLARDHDAPEQDASEQDARGHDEGRGGSLRASDLARFDQFHMGGSRSTARLAELARPARGNLILDVGAGIGGPARQLADDGQVTVVAFDLTESFCRDCADLSRAVGLEQAVLPCCGDATRLPFPDGCFDLVWTQHAAMNIPDKAALYREAARVLKAGGLLALHDIMAGPAGPPYYPAPWAGSAEQSALLPPEEVRSLILDAGLQEEGWRDGTARLLQEQREARARRGDRPPDPGPHLLYPDFLELARNLQRSLREQRATVVTGLFRKGGP